MKVLLTAEARNDIREIAGYIARDNPTRARSFVRDLRAKALGIGDVPHGFPVVPRYPRSGIRRRAHGSYLILYRVRADSVEILRFVHAARNYEETLGLDE